MNKILLSFFLIFISISLFAKITPLPDIDIPKDGTIEEIQPSQIPEDAKNSDIQEIEIQSPKEENSDFDAIAVNEENITEETYNNELETVLKEYSITPVTQTHFYEPWDVYRPPQGDAVLSSKKITFLDNGFDIHGNTELSYDYYFLKGDNFIHIKTDRQDYNLAENIMFTTCSDHDHPHWSVIAKEIKLTNTDKAFKLRLNNVGFVIGKIRCIWLPFFTYNINKNSKSAKTMSIVPFIRYSKSRGLGIKYKTNLYDSDRFNSNAVIRWSTKRNWNYTVEAEWALDRAFGSNPFIKKVSMSSMIDHTIDLKKYSPSQSEYKKNSMSHLRLNGATVWKDTDSTTDGEDVDIYRTIDLKLRYIMDPIGNTDAIYPPGLIAPSFQIGYAREKDDPVIKEYINKYYFSALMPYALGQYKGINIQPFLKFSYYNYKNYTSYRQYSIGLDLSKYYKDGSFWNLRYIQATDSGKPLFESLNRDRGIMAAGAKTINDKYIIGGWIGHNFNKKRTYNLGIMAGIKEDCFWSALGYDFKDKKIHAKIEILGF